MRKMHIVPIVGGILGAIGVIAAVTLAPHMPTQAQLAPEETALLSEWARVGDALAVQRMVEQGACVEAVSADGSTALMNAAEYGHVDVAQTLLMHNAQVNAVNARGETALHVAVRNNQPEMVAFLLKNGASVDARSTEGETPLMVAAWSGFVPLVQTLVTAGADVELTDETGAKASFHARTVQDAESREQILKILGN